MRPQDPRQMAADLLDLVQRMEQTLKDYCRLLSAQDDGHWRESKSNDEPP